MKTTAPELKIASAINYAKKEGSSKLYDISVAIQHAQNINKDYLVHRNKKGQKTTFYVCCGPDRPNTFPHSPPAESAWMGIHAAAIGYDGFLRWAYNSWVIDPIKDTHYPKRKWAPGDCFLVYPGARSSMRFERLREGIQQYEKIRIIKTKLNDKQLLMELDKALKECTFQNARKNGAAKYINSIDTIINKCSKNIE